MKRECSCTGSEWKGFLLGDSLNFFCDFNGIDCADYISFDAGNLHKTRDGITDESQQIFQAHGSRLYDCIAAAAAQKDERTGCHCGGGSDLGLTAAGGACDTCTRGDDLSNTGCDEEGKHEIVFRENGSLGSRCR